jgi:type IV secretion/conjugal transfer VirB4 family ATPase
MTRIDHIVRDYRNAGELNGLLNLLGFVDGEVFMTKSGDVGIVLTLDGLDDECLDMGQREHVVQQYAHALRLFDERFRLYQYLIKRRAPTLLPQQSASDVAGREDERRAVYLNSRELYAIDVAIVVLLEANAVTTAASMLGRFSLSERLITRSLDRSLSASIAVLRAQVHAFCDQLADSMHPRLASKPQAFALLRRLLNYTPGKADTVRLKRDDFLDVALGDSALECHRSHLKLDDSFVRVLTLKEPPGHTYAAMLRELYALPSEFIAVTEWKRESVGPIRRAIQAKRRHFHNSKASLTNYLHSTPPSPEEMLIDDGASASVADLGACLKEMEMTGSYFGVFSLTLIAYACDEADLQRSVSACMKTFAAHDAVLIDERYNLLNAWLAAIPGGTRRNLRFMHILNTNYADLSFLFTVDRGAEWNAALGAEYLAALETDQRTTYFLNLHRSDVAHSVVLGSTGSGKSFLLNFLLTHAQKYEPYTVIFDLGGGYKDLTRTLNGSYLRVGLEHRAFTINPFALEPSTENLHFLYALVKVLIEAGGQYRLTSHDDRDLYEQIGNLYEIESDQRRLLTLAHMLPRSLSQHLHRWVGNGPYARLFDNVTDTLTCATFQAFDFEGLDKYPQLLEPLLFYVLHRANATIHAAGHAARFKLFVLDEAWRFLRNPTIKDYLTAALKTWRKRNAAVIMATQSADDLDQSDVLRVVVESCATKIFLANPGCDASVYRDVFGLNETEIAHVTRLVPRQQLLIKQGTASKILNLNVGLS